MGIPITNSSLRHAVFLDRDGVLNRVVVRDGRPYPPSCLAELRVLPGTRESLLKLQQEGFLLYVVTNQPDVARGTQRRSVVEAMHVALREALPLNGIYTCYHDDADACECRKPKPGLLLTAASEHRISLPTSYMIGDRWRDVEAGHNAGCQTVWIKCGYTEWGPTAMADVAVQSLAEAVAYICREGAWEMR